MKTRYDRAAADSDGFNELQLVLFYNPKRSTELSHKLQSNCDGAIKIMEKLNDVVSRIEKANSPERRSHT